LRLGASYLNEFSQNQTLTLSLDFNKLLVPSRQVASGESGKTVIDGLFSSFTDAPGGLKEELEEITVSTGLEYWYNKRFALRTGYFNEARNKGNRKFFSAGAGIKLNSVSIDFSYLLPTDQNSPLANVMRFSILFNTGSFKKNTPKDINADTSEVSVRNF
jgi:hypothetical protein